MFLLAYFLWLCLFNSLLAYPLNQYKDSNFKSGIWSGQGDYPDLTRGLTDAEVNATLHGFTMDSLKNVDYLIIEEIAEREGANKASLRAQNRKNFRAAGSSVDNGCREENECDEPKQVSRCKPQTCPTTKRCMKTTTTTCTPKTTRTTKLDCVPKTTPCGSMDIFAKCPKVNKRRKKSKDDNEWESDDFQGQARKQMGKGRNIFQELDLPEDAPAKYNPAKDLAGIEKIGGDIIPSLNDQGEPLDEAIHLDYPKESRLMQPAQLHDNPAKRKPEPLAKFDQGHHAIFEEHQSHFEQANHKLQHETNLNRKHEVNFGREQEVSLKQNPEANVQHQNYFKQDLWANDDPANWDDLEQTDSDRMKLANWANLDPANLANIEDANWDLTKWSIEEHGHHPQLVQEQNNFELGKQTNFQPAQEQPATFQVGNQNQNFKQDNQAKLEKGNHAISEHENRPNLQLQNQDRFEQTHQNRLVRDYQQADLNRDQPQHQDRELRSEVNLHPSGHQFSRKRNAEQESRASMPHREQQSDVNYHPRQWSSNQPSTNQEKLNKVKGEPAPLYEGHQFSRKRNAEQESQASITLREQQSNVNYHPRQWSSNQPSTNQEKLNKVDGEPAPFERYEARQISRKRNAEQESQASMPQGGTYREQRSEVKYHPRAEQWPSNQHLTNQAKLNKMDEGHPAYQKRNAKVEREKRRVSVQEKEQLVTKNNEPQPVNAELTKQGSHFEADRFLAKNARDPPHYLNSMQNDRIQRENERRLNKDRSLSESLNLDKLAGKETASPAGESEWATDNKRGKREYRSRDDASENSRETYLKKLMESFPRDQGSQINANVALKDSPFAHERMKRS